MNDHKTPWCTGFWRPDMAAMLVRCMLAVALLNTSAHGQLPVVNVPALRTTTKVPTLVFRIALDSLEPQAITIKPGIYSVRLINYLIPNKTLRMTVDSGLIKLAERDLGARAVSTDLLVNFQKGTHFVSVADVKAWRSTVIVEDGK